MNHAISFLIESVSRFDEPADLLDQILASISQSYQRYESVEAPGHVGDLGRQANPGLVVCIS
ncbi:MAG: hypothetical protein ACREFQ_17425 [Stellaceae bacterium]